MLTDIAQIPTWALVVLGALALAFIALVIAVCRTSAYYSRLEEQWEEEERRYRADEANEFRRSATRRVG